MDSKIIAAIIIGVAMVTSVYLYTQDTAYNRCVEAKLKSFKHMGTEKEDAQEPSEAMCMHEQENFKQ